MLDDVRDLLDRAGFRTRASGQGVTAEAVPGGVRVLWQPDLAQLGPIGGIKAAMYTAMGSILESAGFQVRIGHTDLLVAAPAVASPPAAQAAD